MPRGPRVDAPGTIHHVMVRGVERRLIFLDDLDRLNLLRRLSRILPESGCDCFAWAFMPNHMHLVVRTGDVAIGRVMARVGTGYAGYFNRRYGRVGHLVQNRFKSRPVLNDADLMNLIRYVHLNPVSAQIVSSLAALAKYPWSGHAALMGDLPQRFHNRDETLRLFGEDPVLARIWLREFMRARLPENVQSPTENTDAKFRKILSEACRLHGVDPADLKRGRRGRDVTAARRHIALRATAELTLSKVSIARAIGVSDAAVNYLLRTRTDERLLT